MKLLFSNPQRHTAPNLSFDPRHSRFDLLDGLEIMKDNCTSLRRSAEWWRYFRGPLELL